jgi:hypothetical protein
VSAERLALDLEALGLRCAVEPRERLAVLVPLAASAAVALVDEPTRREAVRLARACGFTHLAVELVPADAGRAADAEPVGPAPRPPR